MLIEQVNRAQELTQSGAYNQALEALETGYNSDFWASEYPTATAIAMLQSLELLRKITSLPEVAESAFIRETIENMQQLFEDFVNEKDVIGDLVEASKALRLLVLGLYRGSEALAERNIFLGKTQGEGSFALNLNEEGQLTMQLFSRMSEQKNQGMNREEAQALQQSFLQNLNSNEYQAAYNQAAQLCTQGYFDESLHCLQQLLDDPANTKDQSSILTLMGANHFYREAYETAIQFYLRAQEAGEAPERAEFNVWEACQAAIAQNPERQEHFKALYAYYFPEASREL